MKVLLNILHNVLLILFVGLLYLIEDKAGKKIIRKEARLILRIIFKKKHEFIRY